MKYENHKQRRKVSEFMDAILLPLKHHLKEEEQELLEIGLRIIKNANIEKEKEKKIGDLTLKEAFELNKKHCQKDMCCRCPIKDCKDVICDLFLNIDGEDMPEEYLDQEIEVEDDEA